MSKAIYTSGMRFGRWVLLERDRSKTRCYWMCKCDCGTVRSVCFTNLRSGSSKSCGCYKAEVDHERFLKHEHHRFVKHGQHGSPEYNAWRSMKERVKPTSPNHAWYYDKGVTVCEQWTNSFEDFLADVGLKPSPYHSLDRFPDPNGNYEPGNVRWATASEQSLNRRNAQLLTFQGRTQNADTWSRELGINTSVITRRLQKGWPVEKVLSKENFSLGGKRATSKLTKQQVVEIRNGNLSCHLTGLQYGITPSTVNEIRRRLIWKHVS